MKTPFYLLIACFLISCTDKTENEWLLVSPNSSTTIYLDSQSDELVKWAVNDFVQSLHEISDQKISVELVDKLDADQGGMIIGLFNDPLIRNSQIELKDELEGEWEKFIIEQRNDQLIVVGSDMRGTIYAIFELAEQLGISPWKWWADVNPIKKESIVLNLPSSRIEKSPSVKFRGIFLNDEDWGLQPWAANTFEPEVNDIGPKTYEKIFQLLLRLKANTIWPAMHPSTKAFFSIPGNKEMAEKYHIFVGTSHAEPMLRNNVDEWDEEENGPYNYFTNSEKVKEYWQERITDTKSGNYIYTLGMRGIHDSGMEGNASEDERIQIVENILQDQRNMLEETLDKPITEIPQMFIPYKEVLDLYNNGMEVPEDVTLMWTDDNYGYIRRLSNEEEQKRVGGSGVYYHLSYWGRPHDYLWLSTTQPGLIWYEMTRAYQNGAHNILIANVGDIKPAEYNMEFFLDLAWDVNSISENSIQSHLENWCVREFGEEKAREIAELLNEYYRLAFLRKPEYMGWSQTEPTTATRPTAFTLTNNNELQRRIDSYQQLSDKASALKNYIPDERLDAYFQLVEYPIKGASLMNLKFLYAQKSMYSESEKDRQEFIHKSQRAYEDIIEITTIYNEDISDGKWNKMMSMKPRGLPVFDLPEYHLVDSLINDTSSIKGTTFSPVFIQAKDFSKSQGFDKYQWQVINGLGYYNSSITLSPYCNQIFEENNPYLEYEFEIDNPGDFVIEVRCLPTHSNNFDFQVGVTLNDNKTKEYSINTVGRSDSWKENVLRNAAVISHPVSIKKSGTQTLQLTVSHTGIVFDQIAITPADHENYYEIPGR